MSYTSAKGYRAEHAVELVLNERTRTCYRPRAGCPDDIGDIAGLPLVVSVKNHATMRLGDWVSDLNRMVIAAHLNTGVVWHKRIGKGDPRDWYVTTTGRFFLPFFDAYCDAVIRS